MSPVDISGSVLTGFFKEYGADFSSGQNRSESVISQSFLITLFKAALKSVNFMHES